MRQEIAAIEVTCSVREGGQPCAWGFAFENSAFSVTIGGGTARFRFRDPLASFEEAERRVNSFLHSWEGDLVLQTGSAHRDFVISGTSAPGRGGRSYLYGTATVSGPLAEANTRRYEPWRRHRYYELPLVASLVQRYEDYKTGRERLSVLGYVCYTVISAQMRDDSIRARRGGKGLVARRLGIEPKVLHKFTELTSRIGTVATARKWDGEHHEPREYTASEKFWLERVTLELIRRFGEINSGRQVDQLGLSDLPQLEAPPPA